ncbi:hypothetical protein LTR36_006566 [Oleoguttula mirabilis]|uniref:Uncharacterized protein n=1 Tax=Oleoguttula mirabilis TaxID=1507867 RepID=A0AAV9JW75_9PEZI|nr:hypothetical protein LTR36_006566 [Oleoguttula mirabilis]
MPKAPPTKGRGKSSRTTPIPTGKPIPKAAAAKHKPAKKPRDPTHSHLYTDDNPSTTIHGTGFKDAAAAHRTLELIGKRSLTYQFQTVNTLFHRAKHHPTMKRKRAGGGEVKGGHEAGGGGGVDGAAGMKAAMDVFSEWLDVTYPASKAGLRGGGGFKPLLSKKTVGRFLPRISGSSELADDAKTFARMYVELGKGKRLGNVLVDETRPAELDWEAGRYGALCALVPEGKEAAPALWEEEAELWCGEGDGEREVTAWHLELIAWAWSPLPERKLGWI